MADKNKKIQASKGKYSIVIRHGLFAASYLKTGCLQGAVYQLKILVCTAWRLGFNKNHKIKNWSIGTEVRYARGFHDLVLKYDKPNKGEDNSSGKSLYRFVQIKHKSSKKNTNITNYHLTSKNKLHRQCSLIYLFKSYVNMLGQFENITPEQIVDLIIFTNMSIAPFKFLVPVTDDVIFGFEKVGKKFRIDIKALMKEPGILICLYNINSNQAIINGFLKKLMFLVCQPSEMELENQIIKEMGETFIIPQIFYDKLYQSIINWFLVYEDGKAPYFTEKDVKKCLEETEDIYRQIKEMKTDSILNLSNKLASLTL
ncbi:hypothetical protein PUN28_004548 [Cardiocondyla obscurior]|uniref:Uncharacterized protein n=1 Tax=Cardiocondyla obscurior TaxID=286306 RepID=A0AAW2GBB5_9HYME